MSQEQTPFQCEYVQVLNNRWQNVKYVVSRAPRNILYLNWFYELVLNVVVMKEQVLCQQILNILT